MSPDVWNDAKPIIAATAAAVTDNNGGPLLVEWPNESFSVPDPPNAWLSIDIGGEAAEALELGGKYWEERGAIYLHLMLPMFNGVDKGLAWRKAFSVAFRAAVPSTQGLYYDSHSFDPLGPDDGVWRRLTLIVRYRFTDLLQ